MLQRYDFAFSFDRSKPDETDKTAVETDKRSVETDGSIIYTVPKIRNYHPIHD